MLICLTASHRNASFDLLEKLSFGAPSLATTLLGKGAEGSSSSAVSFDGPLINGAVVLATCNRFEAYIDVDGPVCEDSLAVADKAIDMLALASDVAVDDVRTSLTVLSGDSAAEHLFSVSAGLESVVVGEGEIAGQVRRALETARSERTTSTTLERLFQRASTSSRGVKTKTRIGAAGRSLVRLSLELAESRVTDWAQTRVLLIGTGQYARVSLASLRDRGVKQVHVFSPSGRAGIFAAKHDVLSVAADGLIEAIAAADIVVTVSAALNSSADSVVLTHADVAAASVRADSLPRRLIIDLGLPRNVDPLVADIDGVELLDLETIGLHAPIQELTAESDARAFVGEAAAQYLAARAEDEVTPAVVALRKHMFDLLDAEIARARGRGDSSAETEHALRHLIGVVLHTPSVRSRQLARAGEASSVIDAVTVLFGVTAEPETIVNLEAVASPAADDKTPKLSLA